MSFFSAQKSGASPLGCLMLGVKRVSDNWPICAYAMDNDLTLKEAALKLGYVTEAEFDRVVDPKKMVKPYVAAAA
jgi:hypothetical protein